MLLAVEEEFVEKPEGKALYEAETARKEAKAAATKAEWEKNSEAELAQKEAEERAAQLKRIRATCRAFHTCMELKRESCTDERWLFDLAYRAADFDATTPAWANDSDRLCRNRTGPCK